jgi:hypothetical protein
MLVERHGLQVVEQRRAAVPGRVDAVDLDVVAVERAQRDADDLLQSDLTGEAAVLVLDRPESSFVPPDEVHLVHSEQNISDTDEREQIRVATRLRDDTLLRIDEDDARLGGGGSRDHVSRVLLVSGCIRDDESPARRCEEPVCGVDRDALLALGDQPVQEQREVEPPILRAEPCRVRLERGEVVIEDKIRFVEESTDERALAVVDAAAGDKAEELLAPLPLEVRLGLGRGAQK